MRRYSLNSRWLRCGGRGGGFAAGDADDAEHGQFGEGVSRDKNAVSGGIQIGRGDLDAVVEHREADRWGPRLL